MPAAPRRAAPETRPPLRRAHTAPYPTQRPTRATRQRRQPPAVPEASAPAPPPAPPTPAREIPLRRGSLHKRGILTEIDWWRVQVGQLPPEEPVEEGEEGEEGAVDGEDEERRRLGELSTELVVDGFQFIDGFPYQRESIAEPPTFVPVTPAPSPPTSPRPAPARRLRDRRPAALVRAATFSGIGLLSPGSTATRGSQEDEFDDFGDIVLTH